MSYCQRTDNLDVVYFVTAYPASDLRFSIRSVAENLEFNKLWIYGGKNSDIVPDEYISLLNQSGADKWAKVRGMYRKVCMNDDITEDFILFHDDFFVLKPTKSIEPEWRCSLMSHAEIIEASYNGKSTSYTKLLRKTLSRLGREGYTTYSYELHQPFVFNRKKLLKILDNYANEHCIRSIYANVYKVGGKQKDDVKINDLKCSNIKEVMQEWRFVSTGDQSFAHGQIGKYLRSRFNKRCRFEKPVL